MLSPRGYKNAQGRFADLPCVVLCDAKIDPQEGQVGDAESESPLGISG